MIDPGYTAIIIVILYRNIFTMPRVIPNLAGITIAHAK